MTLFDVVSALSEHSYEVSLETEDMGSNLDDLLGKNEKSLQDDAKLDLVDGYPNLVDCLTVYDSESPPRVGTERSLNLKNYKKWNFYEDVFLIGVAVGTFLEQDEEMNTSKKRSRRTAGLNISRKCWDSIEVKFTLAITQFGLPSGEGEQQTRNAKKLERRFKYIRSQNIKQPYYFHALYKKWEELNDRPGYNGRAPSDELKFFDFQRETGNECNSNKRERPWTHEEDVFLIGAVMHRFLSHGSLCTQSKNGNKTNNCWQKLQNTFRLAWARYHNVMNNRSANAIKTRYKFLREQNAQIELGLG